MGADCAVGVLQVVQEVEGPNDVVHHPQHLHLLVVDIDGCSLAVRQAVDLLVPV